MIAVALTDVEHDLDAGLAAVSWLVSGYLVAQAVAQPLGGRIGDRIGHRTGFLLGLLAFLAASAAAAAAPWLWALVALRVVQALAGALMLPNASALLRDVAPPERRGRLFGWFGTVMGLSAALGPVVGGILVAGLGWRSIFVVNLPPGALALAAGLAALPGSARVRGRLLPDPLGALVFTAMVGGLVATLMLAPDGTGAWAPAAALTLAAGLAFALVERRAADPFVAPALLRRRPFAAATGTILLHNLVLYALLLLVPLIGERRLDLSERGQGLLLGAMTGAMAVVAPLGGELSDRLGRRLPAVLGSLLALGAVAVLLAIVDDPALWAVATLLAVAGLGVGLAAASLQISALESAPERMVALAGGVFMTARYTGGIGAAGLMAAVAPSGRFASGLAVLCAAAALAAVTSMGLRARPEHAAITLESRMRERQSAGSTATR
jgi:MFS family permease